MKITKKNLVFPCELKEKFLKMINTSRISIEFFEGKKLVIKQTNVGIEEPNRIIFSNKINYIEAFVYENSSVFYIKNLPEALSLNKLIQIVNNHL